jgi:hypothetical protein
MGRRNKALNLFEEDFFGTLGIQEAHRKFCALGLGCTR